VIGTVATPRLRHQGNIAAVSNTEVSGRGLHMHSEALVGLDPRWFGSQWSRFGVTFLCPHCRDKRIVIPFEPMLNHSDAEWEVCSTGWESLLSGSRWLRGGDTFNNLTLTPPRGFEPQGKVAEHWHGAILDGMVSRERYDEK